MSTALVERPYVLEDLSEEEAYLFALLTDESGLDQAEFLWYDGASDDHIEKVDGELVEVRDQPSGCFRAWDFQVPWWRCNDPYQIDQCARSVGKSQSIVVRACAFPFVMPGSEMVITAPELIHLEPLVSKVESRCDSVWLLSQMLPKGKSAITHRPFQMNFLNDATIIGRIPQLTGKGMKGIHPVWLELDEAQDFPKPGWKEVTETLKRGTKGAVWRAHGVTRGVQDEFYEKTKDESHWTKHRYQAMWRPNFTDQERNEAIAEYDSREDPDYRRNVLGMHGDAMNPIFVTSQLMKNVDNLPLSDYNVSEYYKLTIKSDELERQRIDITAMLDFPAGHLSYLGNPQERRLIQEGRKAAPAIYWVGMDIGFTQDPSEILVFVEYKPTARSTKERLEPSPKGGGTVLKLLTRLSLWRMPIEQQTLAILAVIQFYQPKVFAMDRNGIGYPMWQLVQTYLDHFRKNRMDRIPSFMHGFNLELAASAIKGYTFGEILITGIDNTVELKHYEDPVEKAGEKKESKTYATDTLRELVDGQKLWLPWDEVFLKQFMGATVEQVKGGMDMYGRRQYSKGNDHCLDAAREMALAWTQHGIEEIVEATKRHKPVYDSFM